MKLEKQRLCQRRSIGKTLHPKTCKVLLSNISTPTMNNKRNQRPTSFYIPSNPNISYDNIPPTPIGSFPDFPTTPHFVPRPLNSSLDPFLSTIPITNNPQKVIENDNYTEKLNEICESLGHNEFEYKKMQQFK